MIPLDIETLKKDYVLANTAAQLYRSFKSNSSVRLLGEKEKLEILVEGYKSRASKEQKTIEDLVELYAILIAISLHDYEIAVELLKKLDTSALEWGVEFIDIYQQESRPTLYIAGQVKGLRLEENNLRAVGSISNVKINGQGVLINSAQIKSNISSTNIDSMKLNEKFN